MTTGDIIRRLKDGNTRYIAQSDRALREDTARHGQHPCAIIICCSDSRVIPERIFSADLGEFFVIRVAGNVLDNHQLGSIEYAAAHLNCGLVIVLGHTGCGAVQAALSGHGDGYITYITEDILAAADGARDPAEACRRNVLHGVDRIRREFAGHPEMRDIDVRGAIYDIESGEVAWLP